MNATRMATTISPARPAITGIVRPLHSRNELHGVTASDMRDASLEPLSCAAYARQTYAVPLARPPTWALVSPSADPSAVAGHVAPWSDEHSYWKPVTPAPDSDATLTLSAPSSGSTVGLSGAGGTAAG